MSESDGQRPSADQWMAILESYVGKREGGTRTARDPVNEPMIRHWCDAIGDLNPSYLDPEFAKRSRRGGIIAPPTMLQAWTMPGLRPPGSEPETDEPKSAIQVLDEAGFTSVVATDSEQEYFRDLRPGDELSFETEIESISPEKKTALGVGHFLTWIHRFHDASGEVVAQMRFRILKFRPPERARPVIGPRLPGGRPRPSLNQDVAFFWEGAAQGRLLIQRCRDCGALRHPPGPGCPECRSLDWEPAEMSGRGEIYSFVRHHHPSIPPFESGHPVVLVQLDEGPRLVSELVDHDAVIEIGQRVEVQFDEVEEGFTMPRFRIVAEAPTDPSKPAPRSRP
jgi:uncharacterized OB-fold protein/acyl dehydratase